MSPYRTPALMPYPDPFPRKLQGAGRAIVLDSERFSLNATLLADRAFARAWAYGQRWDEFLLTTLKPHYNEFLDVVCLPASEFPNLLANPIYQRCAKLREDGRIDMLGLLIEVEGFNITSPSRP